MREDRASSTPIRTSASAPSANFVNVDEVREQHRDFRITLGDQARGPICSRSGASFQHFGQGFGQEVEQEPLGDLPARLTTRS